MTLHNDDIAVVFEEIADLLEIEAANPFRVRAYRNAARTLRSLSRDVSSLVGEGLDLTTLPGIGKDLSAKIYEILETGKIKVLEDLHKEVPASVEDLLKLPGLGPKRVKTLFYELGIRNLVQLEQAARKGQLHPTPGFGIKTEQRILNAINASRLVDK